VRYSRACRRQAPSCPCGPFRKDPPRSWTIEIANTGIPVSPRSRANAPPVTLSGVKRRLRESETAARRVTRRHARRGKPGPRPVSHAVLPLHRAPARSIGTPRIARGALRRHPVRAIAAPSAVPLAESNGHRRLPGRGSPLTAAVPANRMSVSRKSACGLAAYGASFFSLS